MVMDNETYKEKFSFQLSGIRLFVVLGVAVFVLIALTSLLIAFTPIKELIPGFPSASDVEESFRYAARVDSLEQELSRQEWMIASIQQVIAGNVMPGVDTTRAVNDSLRSQNADPFEYFRCVDDSLLRAEIENDPDFKAALHPNASGKRKADAPKRKVKPSSKVSRPSSSSRVGNSYSPNVLPLLFRPFDGTIVSDFDPAANRLGIVIATDNVGNDMVKAAFSGTVFLADLSPQSGFVIAIAHPNGLVSVYKCLGSLAIRQGDVVRTGDPIAFVPASGSTMPSRLVFELWHNGRPVNPAPFFAL